MNYGNENIGAIILAGGLNSRMGKEKGLISWKGKTFVEHIIDAVKPITSDIRIVTNHDHYGFLNVPTHKDLIKSSGPLSGIYTGLYHSSARVNFVFSCDTPCLRTDLLKYMLSESQGYDVTCPVVSEKLHPLTGIYTKECMSHFKTCLSINKRSVIEAIRGLNINMVELNELNIPNIAFQLQNINTPQELTTLKSNNITVYEN
jgi:molybdopterin-guanine dinucleotide biosynthesis protein A